MNRIVVENDIVVSTELNSNVRVSFTSKTEEFAVNKLVIDILANTTLEIIYHNETALKLDIVIRIAEGIEANLFEMRTGNLMKIQYRYELDNDSTLNIQKMYHIKGIKELDHIYLNGERSKINYLLKTIAVAREKYDLNVYHNGKKTESTMHTNGITILEGSIDFHVSGMVPNGKTGCILDQKNRIVNLNQKKCSIHPNLFIDEFDVIANHSAWIGNFKEEELFYLESRGLKEDIAIYLLVRGFIFSHLNLNQKQIEQIDRIIQKYWR